MERGRFYQQFGETSRSASGEAGSARQVVTDLINRQRLGLPDINEYCLMWSDLRVETSSGRVPEAVHQTVVNVSNGLDFLLFDKVGEVQQESILSELERKRKILGVDRYVLPYEDAQLLQLAAAAVNVGYDPGGEGNTPENMKKRTFVFADLAGIPVSTTNVVDAGK